MHTNENKKRKTSRTMGRVHNRARDDCFHPAINARTFTCHQDLPAFPHTPASVHADAMLRFASPPHSCRAQPMPAFSALSPRFHSSPPLTAAAAPPTHARGVHMYTCVQRESLLSVVWRIPPPWDHVYIVFNRASMSRRRRRRRGV